MECNKERVVLHVTDTVGVSCWAYYILHKWHGVPIKIIVTYNLWYFVILRSPKTIHLLSGKQHAPKI